MRTQEFLASHDVLTTEQVDAKKFRFGADTVLPLLNGIDTLIVARGKKTTEVDLAHDRPDDATLVKMLLGPSGNLRAPTLKIGRRMLVGFNEEMFAEAMLS